MDKTAFLYLRFTIHDLRLTSFLHSLAAPYLIAQAGESQVHFVNLKLIRLRTGSRQKSFVGSERLLVFSKKIVGCGNEIICHRQIGLSRQQPLEFIYSVWKLFQFIERSRQIRVCYE